MINTSWIKLYYSMLKKSGNDFSKLKLEKKYFYHYELKLCSKLFFNCNGLSFLSKLSKKCNTILYSS